MTNSGGFIIKASAIVTIVTGMMMALAWLSGRSSLPELLFGKEAEVVLPATKSSTSESNPESYKKYADSLFQVQEEKHSVTISDLQKRIDSMKNVQGPEFPPTESNCNFGAAVYYNSYHKITFHSVKGNIYQFNGEVHAQSVNGKVLHNGNKLSVVKGSGNVAGEMTLLNGCDKIVGTLYENGYPLDVDLIKQ